MMSFARKLIILFSLLFFLLVGIGSALSAADVCLAEKDATAAMLMNADKCVQSIAVLQAAGNADSASHKKFPALKQRPRGKRDSLSLAQQESSAKISLSLLSPPFSETLYHQSAVLLQKPSLEQLRFVVLLN